ncbi:MAG TPA: long-chain-fatty-acid--CoA ligase [Hyphomicrobiaceae bacterium]|nr:long-chain-fatty-acid--CoA ligase [Hyphomicrobiaceae bacterium]
MDRIWLKNYPAGVPADIDPSRYSSLVEMCEESFAKYRDSHAYLSMDKTLTYGQLDRLSAAFAAWLQSRGLVRGDRVAVMMPNLLQYPVAVFGILRAGCVVVNVNPLYTPRELEHQLKDSGAKAIVIVENFARTLEQVLPRARVQHIVLASMGDMLGFPKGPIVNLVVRKVKKMVPAFSLPGAVKFNHAVAAGRGLPLKKPAIGPDDVAFLQYTGGTTGVSKGATLTNRNVVANVLQNEAWLQPAFDKGGRPERFTIVTALPLYHIFALTVCALLGMRVGGRCLLIVNPRDIPAVIKELSKHEFHMLPAVNTLYNALLNHPDFGKINFKGLRAANGGGMAVQRAVAERFVGLTGCPIIEGYGLSETSPVLTCNPATSAEYTGTIGLPVPSTEISIRDEEGRELALGEAGEICARGPQVMAGYWQRPDETAKVMTADGFFRTGDIGVMNAEGHIKIVDRKKDMVLVSGFNVYPNEVEDVVASHPGVLECAVVGVPDDQSGEAVVLFVAKKDPSLTAQALKDFCAQQLTAYKRPRYVIFRKELPKTNVGKVLRRELRDVAVEAVKEAKAPQAA